MASGIPMEKFNLNRFWERTPTLLKYFLVIAIIIVSSYFVFTDKINTSQTQQLDKIEDNIKVTYTLINNFENYKMLQDQYNEKVISYLQNLHVLVEELSDNTNKKFDIILQANSKNKTDVVDKILILNESFDKLSKIYEVDDIEKEKAKTGKKINEYQIGVEKK
jgi:predicted PurR-regulated permease PerM